MRTLRNRPARSTGFVLVGVIMLVLALTILGLSLFSLSSYEAQFFNRGRGANQSLYRGQGAIEMVKVLVSTPPYDLNQAQSAVGHDSVNYAVAFQRRSGGNYDSTGIVDFASESTLTIRVRTSIAGQSRLLQASFVPKPKDNFYKRLFTVAADVEVSDGTSPASPGGPRNASAIRLRGGATNPTSRAELWQNSTDSSWLARATFPSQRKPLRLGGVPVPDVASYLASHATSAPLLQLDSVGVNGGTPSLNVLDMRGPNNVYTYYEGPYAGGYVALGAKIRIRLRGNAIWRCPYGLHCRYQVEIEDDSGAGPDPVLIVVGAPNGVEPSGNLDVGVWFEGGISADHEVSVILVSNGRVKLEHYNDFSIDSDVDRLSVFSQRLYLMGPVGTNDMDMRYDHDMNSVIDQLEADGVLPRGVSGSNYFALKPGSWRDLSR